MQIKRVYIRNLPPLDKAEFDCDARVNLFIGHNGSGKSTILRAINGLHSLAPAPLDADAECPVYGYEKRTDLIFELTVNPGESQEANDLRRTIWDTVPLLFIPATRINLPVPNIFDKKMSRQHERRIDGTFVPYLHDSPNHETLEDMFHAHFGNPVGSFDGILLEDAIESIPGRIIGNRGRQNQFRKALNLGYSCAKSICLEVINDDSPHAYIEILDEELLDADYTWVEFYGTSRIVHYGMGVGTSDDILGEPLYAGALSSGTQGTLLWIYALALKIAWHYDWEDGWEKKPAILLIDEIENHLHPTWQRRVIPALKKHFKGLQIFATTHSPFVVAGLRAGQVHLLNRDSETGTVTATTNDRDIIGWTADEILRTMLGVDDPTDERTANAARELRELRKEEYRSDPAEEEKRQERMRELRQLVDRDLLAGGPMARQREIFEEQFAESLRKYRESQSLNQENG